MTHLYCSLPVHPRRESLDDDIVFVGRYETWYRSPSGYRYIVRETNREIRPNFGRNSTK